MAAVSAEDSTVWIFDAAFDLFVEPLKWVGNRYEDRGARAFGWDRLVPAYGATILGRGTLGAR
jgi:hypothetical protein